MKKRMALLPAIAGLSMMGATDASNVRIIGGDKVSLEQYPFMAGLVSKGQPASQVFCGASVINEEWILTAAHCLVGTNASQLEVITGADTLSKATTANRFQAAQIIMHPNYNDNTIVNDIALIKLNKPTQAQSVAFATDANATLYETGQAVSVAGWGNQSTNAEKYPNQLHAVDLQIADFKQCSTTYNGLESSMICATSPKGDKDSCQGDSGGPLVARTEKGSTVVGIVSFGDKCASKTHPGVYTKVSAFNKFIENNTGISASTAPTPPAKPDNNTDAPPSTDTDPAASDTSTPASDTKPVKGIEITVVEEFNDWPGKKKLFALIEYYNYGNKTAWINNPQVTSSQDVTIAYDDCSDLKVRSGEYCFVELEWNKSGESSVSASLDMDVTIRGKTTTTKTLLQANMAQSMPVGATLDLPEADYFSTDANQWEIDQEDSATGGLSLSSDLDGVNELDLMGLFYSDDAFVLEFDYQLEGATCLILINGAVQYELAAHSEWQTASLTIPANAQVEWIFQVNRRNNENDNKIRIDNLSKRVANVESSPSDASDSALAPTVAAHSGIASTGTGSSGLVSSLALLLLLGARRLRTDVRSGN